jgi:hypothetical protein
MKMTINNTIASEVAVIPNLVSMIQGVGGSI